MPSLVAITSAAAADATFGRKGVVADINRPLESLRAAPTEPKSADQHNKN